MTSQFFEPASGTTFVIWPVQCNIRTTAFRSTWHYCLECIWSLQLESSESIVIAIGIGYEFSFSPLYLLVCKHRASMVTWVQLLSWLLINLRGHEVTLTSWWCVSLLKFFTSSWFCAEGVRMVSYEFSISITLIDNEDCPTKIWLFLSNL